MEDGFDSTSQTSTVFTHESRVFSLVDSQAETVILDMKVESQDSPPSPSLLENDYSQRQRNENMESVSDVNSNVLIASVDSHSNDMRLRDCNIFDNSTDSDFGQPEATWVRENAFINLSTPWIQRNESEQKKCVAFFSDVIHKATGGSPIFLILPIILQMKEDDRTNLMGILNRACDGTQSRNSNTPSPIQELVETDLEDENDHTSKIEEWVNATSLSDTILSRSEKTVVNLISSPEDESTHIYSNNQNNDAQTIINSKEKYRDKFDIDIDIEYTPEKIPKEDDARKTPKKKGSYKENAGTPTKKAKTWLRFDNVDSSKQNVNSEAEGSKNGWITKKSGENKDEDKPKSSKKKSAIQCKVDAIKDLIPDSDRFQNDDEFLMAFSFIKTTNSVSSSKKCSVCACKKGLLYDMYYYQYENVTESGKEHYSFCYECLTPFKHIKDVQKSTFYEMLCDLTFTGVAAQYESMLPNENVRFRVRSRKKWFDNLKLHFEDLKHLFDMSVPTFKIPSNKHAGGISFDIIASDRIKDEIRSEAQVLESNCNLRLKLSCYSIHHPISSSMKYKLQLDSLTKDNPMHDILRRSSCEESLTPNKKQPGLKRYFRPV